MRKIICITSVAASVLLLSSTTFAATVPITPGNQPQGDSMLKNTLSPNLSATAPSVVFQKVYGSTATAVGESVHQTADGGYIFTGRNSGTTAGVDLIKTDANGNVIWEKTYGNTSSDIGKDVELTSDGGYIIVGTTGSSSTSDVYLIKTDAYGNELWAKTYGGTKLDQGYSVRQLSDGGYIICGVTKSYSSNGNNQVYVIRTDSSGNVIWQKTYSNSSQYPTYPGATDSSITLTNDGGFLITGTEWVSNYQSDTCLLMLKLSSNGTELWRADYQSSSTNAYNMDGSSVHQTSDGGFIIGGDYNQIPYLIKTDSNGNYQWDYTYGEGLSGWINSVVQLSSGGYAATGNIYPFGQMSTNENIYLFSTDLNGASLWHESLGVTGNLNNSLSMQVTTDGGAILGGLTETTDGKSTNELLIKVD